MFLATTIRAENPWHVSQLNKEFYTFEGLVHCVYNHLDYFVEDLQSGAITTWLMTQLCMEQLSIELKAIAASGGTVVALVEALLTASAYTNSLSIDPVKEAYKAYVAMPSNMRYKSKGDQALKENQFTEALKYYKNALAVGYLAEIENNIGITYMALDHNEQAMKAFNRCIEGQDRLEYRLNRIRLLIHMGDYEGALKALNHLSGRYDNHEIWYQYGVVYEALNRSEEAIAAYMKALEGDHGDKYLKGFIDFVLKEGHIQLVELWMAEHKVTSDQRTYVKSQVARVKGDLVHYIHLMEYLIEMRPNHLPYIFELIDYFVEEGQIIRALEFVGLIPKEFQSMEEVWYYKVIISRAAGNRSDFHHQVVEITDKWKGEARKVAVR